VTAASANTSASVIFVIMVVLLYSKPEWLLFYARKSSSLRAARFIGIASFGSDLPEKRRDGGRFFQPILRPIAACSRDATSIRERLALTLLGACDSARVLPIKPSATAAVLLELSRPDGSGQALGTHRPALVEVAAPT